MVLSDPALLAHVCRLERRVASVPCLTDHSTHQHQSLFKFLLCVALLFVLCDESCRHTGLASLELMGLLYISKILSKYFHLLFLFGRGISGLTKFILSADTLIFRIPPSCLTGSGRLFLPSSHTDCPGAPTPGILASLRADSPSDTLASHPFSFVWAFPLGSFSLPLLQSLETLLVKQPRRQVPPWPWLSQPLSSSPVGHFLIFSVLFTAALSELLTCALILHVVLLAAALSEHGHCFLSVVAFAPVPFSPHPVGLGEEPSLQLRRSLFYLDSLFLLTGNNVFCNYVW